MKTFPLLAVLLLLPCLSRAGGDDMREWTQRATGKTITGRIMEKDAEGRVKLKLKNGKTAWIDKLDLSQPDLDFVNDWQPMPEGFRPLEVIDLGEPANGKKLIRVRAMSRDLPLQLWVYPFAKWENAKKIPVPAYAMETTDIVVFHDWKVEVRDADGQTVILMETGGE